MLVVKLSYWYPRKWCRCLRSMHPPWHGWYIPYPGPMYPPISPEEELKMLEEYKRGLEMDLRDIEDELKSVEARIEELKKITKK